jgi:hypothetical protein
VASNCTGAAAKAPAKSPTLDSGGPAKGRGLGRLRRGLLGGQVELARCARVVDAHQLRGGARLLEGFGHHQCERLVVVVYLRAAQQFGGVEVALAELAGVARGDDGQHAGRGARGAQVHGSDAPLGDAGADDVAVGRVRHRVVRS